LVEARELGRLTGRGALRQLEQGRDRDHRLRRRKAELLFDVAAQRGEDHPGELGRPLADAGSREFERLARAHQALELVVGVGWIAVEVAPGLGADRLASATVDADDRWGQGAAFA